MIVLVTGGSGFLGSRLVRMLLGDGHQVRATHRPGEDTRLLAGLDVEVRACDLLDRDGVHLAVRGVEAIIHTAALVTFDQRLYDDQMRVNREGTRILLEAARGGGVRRLVNTATVNVLGIPTPGTLGDEGTPFNWEPWRLGYMDSKKAAADLVREPARDGLESLSVLPGTFFGPGDINFNAGTYIKQIEQGMPFALPGGTSVVHVDDIARGHLLALERGEPGEQYILAGDNMSYRALFEMIAEEVGSAPPRLTLPAALLRGLGRLMDRIHRLTGLSMPLGEGLAMAGSAELYYKSAKARRELGYTHRPAREAIRDAVEWYRAEGLL